MYGFYQTANNTCGRKQKLCLMLIIQLLNLKAKKRGVVMCTAATYKKDDLYFGRTLDYEFSYGEKVTVTPRNYPFRFCKMGDVLCHYAFIGVAHISNEYPLYYDAVNEKGLAIAGLNFVGNAHYNKDTEGKDNIAQFELIPWILCKCANLDQARALLERINITDTPFSDKFPVAELHWIISDKTGSITLESVKDGIKIYDNPVGVLTNNPTFDKQMFNLNNYRKLSAKSPEVSTFSKNINLSEYSRGMGAIGLPGDLSSQSRFVRVAFVKENSVSKSDEKSCVSQFFHILNSVDQQRGCCELKDGEYEITIYTSCCNADKGIYYYTTYDNHQITAVDMHREDLDLKTLSHYAMISDEQICVQN